jgi:hypothetical protein
LEGNLPTASSSDSDSGGGGGGDSSDGDSSGGGGGVLLNSLTVLGGAFVVVVVEVVSDRFFNGDSSGGGGGVFLNSLTAMGGAFVVVVVEVVSDRFFNGDSSGGGGGVLLNSLTAMGGTFVVVVVEVVSDSFFNGDSLGGGGGVLLNSLTAMGNAFVVVVVEVVPDRFFNPFIHAGLLGASFTSLFKKEGILIFPPGLVEYSSFLFSAMGYKCGYAADLNAVASLLAVVVVVVVVVSVVVVSVVVAVSEGAVASLSVSSFFCFQAGTVVVFFSVPHFTLPLAVVSNRLRLPEVAAVVVSVEAAAEVPDWLLLLLSLSLSPLRAISPLEPLVKGMFHLNYSTGAGAGTVHVQAQYTARWLPHSNSFFDNQSIAPGFCYILILEREK